MKNRDSPRYCKRLRVCRYATERDFGKARERGEAFKSVDLPVDRLHDLRREGNGKKANLVLACFCLEPIVNNDRFFSRSGNKMDKAVKPNENAMKCTDKEKRLIEMIRALKFGEMRIIIQDSEPVRVEELKNSIKL